MEFSSITITSFCTYYVPATSSSHFTLQLPLWATQLAPVSTVKRPQICLSPQLAALPHGNITSHNYNHKTDSSGVLPIAASSVLKYLYLKIHAIFLM